MKKTFELENSASIHPRTGRPKFELSTLPTPDTHHPAPPLGQRNNKNPLFFREASKECPSPHYYRFGVHARVEVDKRSSRLHRRCLQRTEGVFYVLANRGDLCHGCFWDRCYYHAISENNICDIAFKKMCATIFLKNRSSLLHPTVVGGGRPRMRARG